MSKLAQAVARAVEEFQDRGVEDEDALTAADGEGDGMAKRAHKARGPRKPRAPKTDKTTRAPRAARTPKAPREKKTREFKAPKTKQLMVNTDAGRSAILKGLRAVKDQLEGAELAAAESLIARINARKGD